MPSNVNWALTCEGTAAEALKVFSATMIGMEFAVSESYVSACAGIFGLYLGRGMMVSRPRWWHRQKRRRWRTRVPSRAPDRARSDPGQVALLALPRL